MLRVVLIEDEKVVLKGMTMVLERESSVELVGTAEDGLEGLELIRREVPDLVLTDIRMPELSGLEMIELAQKDCPDVVFVIFSGFNEFKYVQKAIGMGVLDYLEKPVTISDLRRVLERAKGIIEYKRNYLRMKERSQQTNRIMAERLLYKLLNESVEMEKENLKGLLETAPGLQDSFEIAVLRVGKLKKTGTDSDEYRKLMHGLTFSVLGEHTFEVYTLAVEEDILIVYFNQECELFPFRENISREKEKLDEEGISFYAGLSNVFSELSFLKKAFAEAKDALVYAQFLESEEVVCIEDVEYQNNIPSELTESQHTIGFNFRLQKYEDCRDQLSVYLNYLKHAELSPEILKHECYEVVSYLQSLYKETGRSMDGGLSGMAADEVFQLRSSEEMLRWTQEKSEQLLSAVEQKAQEAEHPVKLVKRYIDEHYSESISLEMLAEQVHLNPAYLSVIFKKEEGITYSNYLTEVRIHHAMEMLEQGGKAKEVCEKAGYFDYRYFNKQFKKIVGMTPDTYKRSKLYRSGG